MPTSEDPPILDYSQPQRFAWLVKNRRRLIGVAILLAASILIFRYGESTYQRAMWVYWGRRCASFKMPSDAVPASRDPALIAKYKSDPNYITYTSGPSLAICFQPKAWREYIKYDPRIRLNNDTAGLTEFESSIVFLGPVARPDGTNRVVMISGSYIMSGIPFSKYNCLTVAMIFPPPGIMDPIPTGRKVNWPYYPMHLSGPMSTTYFRSGYIDPIDSTCIRIPVYRRISKPRDRSFTKYEIDSVDLGIVKAFLKNDDSLSLVFEKSQLSDEITKHIEPELGNYLP